MHTLGDASWSGWSIKWRQSFTALRRRSQSPVFHRLRFIASCTLGGALVTGAVLGHDLSGFDPRSIGAAAGLLAGVVAVMTRAV